MIDEDRTLQLYGYTSDMLSKGSHKPIVKVCDKCGRYSISSKYLYRDLCHSCSQKGRPTRKKGQKAWNKGIPHTEDTKKKISKAMKGKKRKPTSEVTRKKQSETHKGKLNPMYGVKSPNKDKKLSELHKQHVSAGHQGIPYDEWEDYAKEKRYCPKFDNNCREANREKYGRNCFICNKTEKANGQKLSVHHVDMNKAQGCNSNWKLVPLYKSCHSGAHNEKLIARLGYLIKE